MRFNTTNTVSKREIRFNTTNIVLASKQVI